MDQLTVGARYYTNGGPPQVRGFLAGDIAEVLIYDRVLSERRMPGAHWFEGAELNYAEHIFRDKPEGAVAVRHASELRPLAELSWGELRRQTALDPGVRPVAVHLRVHAHVSTGSRTARPRGGGRVLGTSSGSGASSGDSLACPR